MDPAFLLLDEPFTGVDPKTVADLQEIIKLLKAKGLGVLITDHNVRETLAITDRAYIIHKGRVLISGNSQEVSQSEAAKKFYLGDKFEL
jgi:lipopolysaccharide export system ATP-binding protein